MWKSPQLDKIEEKETIKRQSCEHLLIVAGKERRENSTSKSETFVAI